MRATRAGASSNPLGTVGGGDRRVPARAALLFVEQCAFEASEPRDGGCIRDREGCLSESIDAYGQSITEKQASYRVGIDFTRNRSNVELEKTTFVRFMVMVVPARRGCWK